MRKQLGTYLFVGGGALFIGLVPTLLSIKDGPWVWILLGVVGIAFIGGLIFQPWRQSPEEKRARIVENTKLADIHEQEISELEIERAKLLQVQIPSTGLSDLSTAGFGIGSTAFAAARSLVADARNSRQIDDMRIHAIDKRLKNLNKIVENLRDD